MSYGLIDDSGIIYTPVNICCEAEVSDDFGLFTVTHCYKIESEKTVDAKFIFPVTDSMEIVSFTAEINERVITSKLLPKPPKAESVSYFSHYRSNGFEVPLGCIMSDDELRIKISFVRRLTSDNERTRIVIPTGIAPRFIYFGSQVALESLFEEIDYNIDLKVVCKNHGIREVVSPTHDIVAEYGENCVEISLKDTIQSDKDIIIDVFSVMMDKPKFIKYQNFMYGSFVPELNEYEHDPRNYMFYIDVSNDMNMRKLQQVKNVIHLAIRALKDGDRFNIAFTQSENTFFSDEYLPVNDDTLRAATKWLNSYEHKGSPEFYRPMLMFSQMAEEALVIYISDGRIAGNSSIIDFASKHKGLKFYNFGFDMAVNQDFLTELSAVTGGKTRFIGHTERIDDTIIKAFNVIVAPAIENAVVRFDSSVSDVTPLKFDKIHFGERVHVMFKYINLPPLNMFIKGFVGGKEFTCTVPVDKVIEGGRELKYRFGYDAIECFQRDIYYSDEQFKFLLRQKIIDKSVEYSVHSKYTLLCLEDRSGLYNYECDVDKCTELSSGWYEPSLNTAEKSMTHSYKEIQFVEIIKKQRANGRFIPSTSRSKEAIVMHTAEVIKNFCENCSNIKMYRWHLRKAVLFLLDYIENADSAVVPDNIMTALNLWKDILGSDDEASQKIEVLNYLQNQ